MSSFDEITSAIRRYQPQVSPEAERPERQASVALILHPGGESGTEILLIERAHREGDPWSGDMAFPGGRRQTSDPTLEHTASRETHEEVGVKLPAALGGLDDIHGSRNPGIPPFLLRPYVYLVPERPQVTPNYEVQSTVWIPLNRIYDPESWTDYVVHFEERQQRFPAFGYQGYTVWGLTFRVLRNFGALLDLELPES